MRYMNPDAAPEVRISEGRYTAARLKRSGETSLMELLLSAVGDIEKKEATARDARWRAVERRADRDAADDTFDDACRTVRLALASESVDAIRVAPYIQVFSEGADWYLNALLDENEGRMRELVTRMETYLPADHPVRVKWVEAIRTMADEWAKTYKASSEADRDADRARLDLDGAKAAYDATRQQVWGSLVASSGKRIADRLFGG